eukprot:CAMPEP_0197849050 /NCGR_PEP_ID=MMETSP1438-20131217/10692_1 /TAXON_ID=1461541 /ORGANISM="Pterosperma sp., Strain CCMP1384" /LENGTH=226 /DNA_ID=CAMNT_0043461561 /DNA_START=159 /DNA_END=839 /DNA_ORIENTATION=+
MRGGRGGSSLRVLLVLLVFLLSASVGEALKISLGASAGLTPPQRRAKKPTGSGSGSETPTGPRKRANAGKVKPSGPLKRTSTSLEVEEEFKRDLRDQDKIRAKKAENVERKKPAGSNIPKGMKRSDISLAVEELQRDNIRPEIWHSRRRKSNEDLPATAKDRTDKTWAKRPGGHMNHDKERYHSLGKYRRPQYSRDATGSTHPKAKKGKVTYNGCGPVHHRLGKCE